eukprot:CAMPEP_0179104296 /NCGR_PEP_ID=MMETSP0796-20121207/48372_1 /TAXON_ID=73915 /ORGANISM="Pyrodinium bahamense, Strain pbaha01" /LENGTH=736 /DNA_ID=CAMNT_0020802233 /DNA_START=75 /DNA_END=2285 /DNA_ORIENTATION=+
MFSTSQVAAVLGSVTLATWSAHYQRKPASRAEPVEARQFSNDSTSSDSQAWRAEDDRHRLQVPGAPLALAAFRVVPLLPREDGVGATAGRKNASDISGFNFNVEASAHGGPRAPHTNTSSRDDTWSKGGWICNKSSSSQTASPSARSQRLTCNAHIVDASASRNTSLEAVLQKPGAAGRREDIHRSDVAGPGIAAIEITDDALHLPFFPLGVRFPWVALCAVAMDLACAFWMGQWWCRFRSWWCAASATSVNGPEVNESDQAISIMERVTDFNLDVAQRAEQGDAAHVTAHDEVGGLPANTVAEALRRQETECSKDAVSDFKEGLSQIAEGIAVAHDELDDMHADTVVDAVHMKARLQILRDEISRTKARLESLRLDLSTGPPDLPVRRGSSVEAGASADFSEVLEMKQELMQLQAAHIEEAQAGDMAAAQVRLEVSQFSREVESLREEHAHSACCLEMARPEPGDPGEGLDRSVARIAKRVLSDQVSMLDAVNEINDICELRERVESLQATVEEEASRLAVAKAEAREEALNEWRRDPTASFLALRSQLETQLIAPRSAAGRGKVQDRWTALREHERVLREHELSVQQHRRVSHAEAHLHGQTGLEAEHEAAAASARERLADGSTSGVAQRWRGAAATGRQPVPAGRTERAAQVGGPEEALHEVEAVTEEQASAVGGTAAALALQSPRRRAFQASAQRSRWDPRGEGTGSPGWRSEPSCLPWMASLCPEPHKRAP